MPTLLWIGISSHDPDFPLPLGVDASKLDAQLDAVGKSMEDAGYTVNCFRPLLAEGIEKLRAELKEVKYDAIIVGVGLRTLQPLTTYFEDIIKAIIELAPHSKLTFNESIDRTLEAARRAVPA